MAVREEGGKLIALILYHGSGAKNYFKTIFGGLLKLSIFAPLFIFSFSLLLGSKAPLDTEEEGKRRRA